MIIFIKYYMNDNIKILTYKKCLMRREIRLYSQCLEDLGFAHFNTAVHPEVSLFLRQKETNGKLE